MENNEKRPKICRIANLSGSDGVLLGRDFSDIFKNGHLYAIQIRYGMHVVTDLGEHAKPEWFDFRTYGNLMWDGDYLLTEEEFEMKVEAMAKEDTLRGISSKYSELWEKLKAHRKIEEMGITMHEKKSKTKMKMVGSPIKHQED